MLDINLLRTDLPAVAAALAKRGVTLNTRTFEALEARRKDIQTRTQELQAKRNALSKQIGIAKGKGEDASALLAEVAGLGDELKKLEAALERVQAELRELLLDLPNITHASTPIGSSADDNVEIRRWGTPRAFEFPVKDHTDLGEALGMLDFAVAAVSRACIARSRNSCSTRIRASTATPSATRPTSSTPRRSSARRSCRSSSRTCSR